MSIRKGNDIIASKPLIDAVPTQNSTNAVSSGGVYNALATKQDTISDLATIRSGAAAGATALQNTATATHALTVLGTANTSWTNGINIGKDSRINSTNGVAIGVDASADVNAVGIGRDTDAGVRGTAIGAYAKTSADTGIAIGCWNSNTNNAVSSAKGAYQFGVGTNSTARTLNVGWYDDSVTPSTFRNYQLLDGNTGLIPDARISTNIARSADVPDTLAALTGDVDISSPTNGQHLVYDGNDQKWKNTTSTATVSWGGIIGALSDQTDLQSALDAKANVDMDNLTSTGANISNWSSNVTNCITYIPQDIKLELNAGVLTLKAGSKVYVPNGAGVFDEVVIASDLIIPGWANNAQGMLSIKPSTSDIWISLMNQQYSGSTTPTSSQYELWYDTDSNKVKTTSNTGSTWADGYSLPIALITSNGSSWTSIDQVFNGFGYIGSTVFALPGVKGLIPNERNADGSLKSIEFTVPYVCTRTSDSLNIYLQIVLVGGTTPNLQLTIGYRYDEEKNLIYYSDGVSYPRILVGHCYSDSSYKISNFLSKTAFHAVDYNNSGVVVAEQMPSSINDYTWYRKYSNGWVEQGQRGKSYAHNSVQQITLPIPMADTSYTVCAFCTQVNTGGSFGASSTIAGHSYNNTKILVAQQNESSAIMEVGWIVYGQAK